MFNLGDDLFRLCRVETNDSLAFLEQYIMKGWRSYRVETNDSLALLEQYIIKIWRSASTIT